MQNLIGAILTGKSQFEMNQMKNSYTLNLIIIRRKHTYIIVII